MILTFPNALSKSISQILDNANDAILLHHPKNVNITIKTYNQNKNTIFEISNEAGHISSDILENIFTPYFSTKIQNNGVGLSLYNCKMIIELHLKGTIEVFNLALKQVMFKITLPQQFKGEEK